METGKISEVIQHLRRTVLLRDGEVTDAQLLQDFISRREPAALAALVQRHGPMVWGVCRRVLGNYHDAEDAFQATFLVLLRKAASIASPALLANWLYGVAHQTALKARATNAKRRTRERQVTPMPEAAVSEQNLCNDLQPLLDVELSQLPDKYRVAIVLCDLEGKTRKQAARQLGVPVGTLAARVARGRRMLARRLTRHGLAVTSGTLGAVLSQGAASAAVPASVMSSTIKAVTLVAAGQAAAGVISARAVALTERVVHAMLLAKLKTMLAMVLVLGAVVLTCGVLARGQANAQAEKGPSGTPEQPVKAAQPTPKGERAGKDEPRMLKLAEAVRSMRWSPDGKYMAGISGGDQWLDPNTPAVYALRIWDGQTGKMKQSVKLEEARMQMFDFSPDSKTIAIGLRKGPTDFLELRDVATGALRRTIEMEQRRTGLWFAFSPDSRTIAVCGSEINMGGTESVLRLFDAKTGERKQELTWDAGLMDALAFSVDGKWLATADHKGVVTIWDVKQWKIHKTLTAAPAKQLQFSSDGKHLLRWHHLSDVTIVEWSTGKTRALKNSAAGQGTQQLLYSPDGLFVAGQSWVFKGDEQKNCIRVWDAATGDLLHEQLVSAWGLAFTPDSKRLVFLQDDKTAMFWDVVPTGKNEKQKDPSKRASEKPGEAIIVEVPDPSPAQKAGLDKEKLQGTWVSVRQEFGGKPVAKEDVRPQWWHFEEDKVTIYGIDLRSSKPEKNEYAYALAKNKNAKTIELNKGRRLEGPRTKPPDDVNAIYQIEGDSLMIAIGKKELPTSFRTKEGDGVVLIVLKREGAAKERK